MTKAEMVELLAGWGVKSRFIPDWDPESETITLRTRKPANIVEGRLHGSRIDADIGRRQFTVWTPRIKKANRVAAERRLRMRHWDGECELTVPAELADEILPEFGAKVRKRISEETREQLRQRALRTPGFAKKRPVAGPSGDFPAGHGLRGPEIPEGHRNP